MEAHFVNPWDLEDLARIYGPPRERVPVKVTELKDYREFCTLEECAITLNLSLERVRQIENAALKKCRRWCEENGYELEELLR